MLPILEMRKTASMGLIRQQKTFFDALSAMVLNLKEKKIFFLVRMDASIPLGQGVVVVSDAA